MAVCGAALAAAALAAPTSVERTAALVEAAAHKHLQQQAEREAWLDPRFELTVAADKRPDADCADDVEIEATDTRYPSRMRFTVSCPGSWRHVFVVRAEISARVVVAATNVPARQPLETTDLMLERRSISATPDAIGNPDAAAGLMSKRALRRGDILRSTLLVAPVLVRRGDMVHIHIRREQIEVSVAGEALDAGGRGDLIRVRNTSTGKVIRARVIAAGKVEPADL